MACVSIKGLSFRYRKAEVLCGLDWEVSSGVTVLLGPNGSGKSTLIKCLAGILPVQEGAITFAEGGSGIGYVPQNPSLPGLARVRDLLSYPAWLSGVPRGEIPRRVDTAVERLDLGALQRHRVRTLSGGELQQVAIGAGVINDPSLLLLDEPTVGLDPSQRMRTRRMIAGLGTSVVMSTHLTEDIQAMEAQVAILSEGKIQASGSSRDLLAQQTSEGYGSSFEAFYERIVLGRGEDHGFPA
ncbi:putative ABC transporter ATP-binding protein YxlF [Corynebacterium oculi]|uniref:Putative ABC transporter ATP-binding protein YxlF n=1 Tax=Corynebacterium oculi TaxID=1544416 RepID=A0A0Q0U7Y8_9CORY|nr:putative ABC transporter ATP-binding protein YxlF [Corynebacterium oculi]